MTTIGRPTRGRLTVVAATWVGATLFGLAVAAETTIGPVVVALSRNHGVHLGDVIAFAGAYLAALCVTILVALR